MGHRINDDISQATRLVIEEFPDFQLECKIGELLEDRGLSLRELSQLTGIRVPSLSFIVNEKKTTINVGHVMAIASALRITDIRQLYRFEMTEDTRKVFNNERREQEGVGMTEQMKEVMARNKIIKEKESEEWHRKKAEKNKK